jgi:hypothetical protein
MKAYHIIFLKFSSLYRPTAILALIACSKRAKLHDGSIYRPIVGLLTLCTAMSLVVWVKMQITLDQNKYSNYIYSSLFRQNDSNNKEKKQT